MNKLIKHKYKYTMFHDEEKNLFVLLSCMEIYKHNKDFLHVSCWKKSVVDNLISQGIVFGLLWKDDEGCYQFIVKVESFDKLLAYNIYKKSEDYKNTWLKNKEHKLGHKIIKHYLLK